MRRFLVLVLAVAAARGALAADRLIPVITGTIGDRTYRTTVDLRSATTEECRFEFRAPDGTTLHEIEPVEAGRPKLLDEFTSGLPVGATTIRVSCTGEVEVHSRIHESSDGGMSFDEGPLFEAAIPEPLAAGQKHAMPVTGDVIVAEVHGAPARVAATLTATSSGRVAEKQYDLAPFDERSIGMTEVLRSLGAIDATFEIEGEGHVIVLAEVIDPAFANRALRASAQLRARLDAQVAAAAPPLPMPSTTALLTSTFQAAPFSDPATGLVFMRNRWYDPGRGTWLSPDPMGYVDSSNLYAFCGSDPVNCKDPTGTIGLRAALTDGTINQYEMETLELTDEETRTIIGSQSALSEVGAGDPNAAKHNLARAKFILLARHSVFQQYAGQLYQFTRGLNPVHFAAEVGWAVGAGNEPIMRQEISRRDKVLELATYLTFLKGTQWVMNRLGKIQSQAVGDNGWERVHAPMRDRLSSNEKGKLGEAWSEDAIDASLRFSRNVDLTFLINGKKVTVNADRLIHEADGTFVYVEAKFSPNARYQPNQKIVIPELVKTGEQGLVATVGSRSGGLLIPGQRIRVIFQGDVWNGQGGLHGH